VLPSVRDVLSAAGATVASTVGDLVPGSRGGDPLAERDPEFIRATLPVYSALTNAYFRPKVRGLEHIPAQGPVLLVGNHSGGTLIADTFAFAYAFAEHFGADRLFHQLAHDMVFKVPGLAMLPRYGTVPASHENAERALGKGAALLVYPGGDFESYRPTSHAARVEFGGRSGFVKLALAQNVPIVPGGRGRRPGDRALHHARRARGEDAPARPPLPPEGAAAAVRSAVGLTVLDMPGRIPLPAQITIQVLPPIDLRAEFGDEPDRDEVAASIVGEMQRALDELSAERDLPVVGSVTPRAEGSAVADELADQRRD
jgi:hypothetical protein